MRSFLFSMAVLTCAATPCLAQDMGTPHTLQAMRRDRMAGSEASSHTLDATRRLRAHDAAEQRRVDDQVARLLASTRTECAPVTAIAHGRTARHRDLYEVACASGFGYLLMNGQPPAAWDCWSLAQAALRLRAADPRADVGSQCRLPGNGG